MTLSFLSRPAFYALLLLGVGLMAPAAAHGATAALDGTPPHATKPVQSLTRGTQVGTSTVPVRFNWSVSDDVSPATSIQSTLQQRTSPDRTSWSAWSDLVGPTAAKRTNAWFTPGTTYRQFRVKAVDEAGNVGYSSAGPAFRVNAYQESNPAITYFGTWYHTSQSGAFGGFVNYSTQPGATATLTATGRSLAVVMPLASSGGWARICLDPDTTPHNCATVDLSPTGGRLGPRKEVFVRNGLSGSITHKVRVSLCCPSRVTLDGFIALD